MIFRIKKKLNQNVWGFFKSARKKKKRQIFIGLLRENRIVFLKPIDRGEKKMSFFFATIGRYRLCSLRSASGGPCGELASGGPCGELSVFESKTFFRLFFFVFFSCFLSLFFFCPRLRFRIWGLGFRP
jgi:hypothetical protein